MTILKNKLYIAIVSERCGTILHLSRRNANYDLANFIYCYYWSNLPEMNTNGYRAEFKDAQSLAPESDKLKSSAFEVVTVNDKGEEIKREQKEAEYYTEHLRNGVTLDLVYIPGDKFMMGLQEGEGQKSEKPLHEVTVQPLFMGQFPVTQAQWRAIASLPKVNRDLEPEPSMFKGNDRPVERVSWNNAVEFCQRLSRQTGKEYRLPSEAEWEYACRAGTITPFHFGETITGKLANYGASRIYANEPEGEYRKQTTPVGSFPPNAFGLYDMHGNVWEWCKDDWHENYQDAPTDGSAWLSRKSKIKVIRGGAWNNGPYICCSAHRDVNWRESRGINIGLRVVRVASRAR